MPRVREGYRQVATQLPAELVSRLDSLLLLTGRTLSEELAHAVERHLASPPSVCVKAPKLPHSKIELADAPEAKRKRGRPRKDGAT